MKYFIVLLLIIVSCNKQNDNPVVVDNPNILPPQNVLIPLKVGNSWTTKYEGIDTNGVVTESRIDTLVIRKDTVINNLVWYQSGENGINRNDTDGYYMYDANIKSVRIFHYPAEVNDSTNLKGSTQYCKLISKNDTIEVNGKRYSTYKYKVYYVPQPNSYSIVELYFYFTPNIGLIKTENIAYYVPSGKVFMNIRSTLLSYILK